MTDRQNAILRAITEEYIKTAAPVGSKRIQEVLEMEVSSATIRNESAFLEEQGYLEKAHTSSGRVPSSKGYRYYVDNLMSTNNIDEYKQQIEELFHKRGFTIDQILQQTSVIISEMTKLATVVSTTNINEETLLTKVQLVSLSESQAVVIFVLSNDKVENQMINLDNVSFQELQIAIELFNERLVNSKISEIEYKSQAILPILKQQIKKYEFVLQTFVNAILHANSAQTKTTGMNNLLQNPEFNDPERIKKLFGFIETTSPFAWFKSQSSNSSKPAVAIGFETGIGHDDFAVIGTNFATGHGQQNSLALIGPKRIEYNKVSELLEWVGHLIEEKVKEGGD